MRRRSSPTFFRKARDLLEPETFHHPTHLIKPQSTHLDEIPPIRGAGLFDEVEIALALFVEVSFLRHVNIGTKLRHQLEIPSDTTEVDLCFSDVSVDKTVASH